MENNKILIQDLAEAIANREGITKKKAETFVKALFEMIEEGLVHDKFVKIKGLGTFKLIEVGERESVNINTGERFSIESHSKISFTPDALLRDLVNAPFAHFQTTILNEETELDELDRVDAELLPAAEGDEEDATGEEQEPDVAADSPAQTVLQPGTDTADENEIITTEETGESSEKEIIIKEEPKEDTASEETENTPETPAEEAGEKEMRAPEEGNTEIILYQENTSASTEEDSSPALQETEEKTQEADEPEDDAEPAMPAATEETGFIGESGTQTDGETEEGGEKEMEAQPQTATEGPDAEPEEIPEPAKNDWTGNSRSSDETATPGERECLQYIIRDERPPRPNIWKVVALALLAALILVLTYFAGYFKLFCPCEIWDCNDPVSPSAGVTAPTSHQPEMPAVQTDSTRKDSTELLPAAAPSDSTPQQAANTTDAVRNDAPPTPATAGTKTENQQNAVREPATRPETYPQVNGGKYQITGTLRTYRVAGGETLRTIAQKIYGSKGYAVYIATYNRIEDPNRIDSGTLLQLPRLERRP